MRVKLHTAMAGDRFSYKSGSVVDLPDDEAEAYIANGSAEKVEPAKKAAAKKAAAKKADADEG